MERSIKLLELTYTIDKAAVIAAVSLEDMLKKYKRERSRKKMQPHYERMLVEVAACAEPQIIFQAFADEVVEQIKPFVPKEMQLIVFAVCTLGADLDKKYVQLSQDELALAAILDEIALAWIVALTRFFHTSARAQCSDQGFKMGPAYRPGVGNIPLEAQEIVFQHLPAEAIGVTLSEFMVMEPARSTSLIIPISPIV